MGLLIIVAFVFGIVNLHQSLLEMSPLETFYHKGLSLSRAVIRGFGEKLHLLRTSNCLTLKELAQALGQASHGYLSELETGKKTPTAELVLNVALLFNVSTDILLKDELELPARSAHQ